MYGFLHVRRGEGMAVNKLQTTTNFLFCCKVMQHVFNFYAYVRISFLSLALRSPWVGWVSYDLGFLWVVCPVSHCLLSIEKPKLSL